MTQRAKGQRLGLRDTVSTGTLWVGFAAQGLPLDLARSGLDSAGKLLNCGCMTDFNRPHTPCGAVQAGSWRRMAFGERFNVGFNALLRHFGGAKGMASPLQGSAKPAQPPSISFEKRLAREAPHLVNLVRQVGVSLQKVGLSNHHAKICVCLDISGWMDTLYRRRLEQSFAERIWVLACQFNNKGEIDSFSFAQQVHQPAPRGLSNWDRHIPQAVARHPMDSNTCCGWAF